MWDETIEIIIYTYICIYAYANTSLSIYTHKHVCIYMCILDHTVSACVMEIDLNY